MPVNLPSSVHGLPIRVTVHHVFSAEQIRPKLPQYPFDFLYAHLKINTPKNCRYTSEADLGVLHSVS